MNPEGACVLSESRGLYSMRWNYYAREKVVRFMDEETQEDENKDRRLLRRVGDDDGDPRTPSWFNGLRLTVKQIFLPYGYPHSVSKDYMNYQIFDTIQAFCSSITGALATEAVMKGVGVGDEAATPLAAALTWLLKSGSGMTGQILFTWAQGTRLDGDCKRWRFFADVVNDGAFLIDLLTPALPPNYRVGIFCVSSIARSLVGVAGGATRAAITQHQARQNNTADVSAKDGSQETLVNLVALITSLIMLPMVSGHSLVIWTLYFVFASLHIFANYKALKTLKMESLNTARLLLCLQQFLRDRTVPSIDEVNERESVFIGFEVQDKDVTKEGFKVELGVSFAATGVSEAIKLSQLISSVNGKNFLVVPDIRHKTVNVILEENVPSWEIIEAYSRSVFLTYHLEPKNKSAMDKECTKDWEEFESALITAGYFRDRSLLHVGDWRATWRKHE